MFFCLFLTVLRAFSCSSVTLFDKFLGALGKFALLANLSIEMRARSRCASGPASLDSRVLSLSEGRARVSTQVGRALIDCPRWPARLRRTAVGAPAFFPRICSGWGCGLSCSKIPLSCCICEIFILRKIRRTQPANRFVTNFFARIDADTRIFREFSCISRNLSVTVPDQRHFLHFLFFS